jgi:hypothetical protein
MPEFHQGHVKRNAATAEVAIRTSFDESVPQLASMAWLVATMNIGARNATTAEVADWDDLYEPPTL